MWFLINMTAVCLQAFFKIFCLYKIFEPKFSRGINLSAFWGFVALDSALVALIPETSVLSTFLAETLFTAVALVYTLIFLKGNVFLKIIVNIIIEVMIIVSVLVGFALISCVTESSFITVAIYPDTSRAGLLTVSTLIFIYEILVLIRLFKNKSSKLMLAEWMLIISVFVCSVIIGISLLQLGMSIEPTTENLILMFIIILTFIAINILTLFLLTNISKKNSEISDLRVNRLVALQQEQSIAQINSKYEEIRKIRHDYKNCVECVTTLMDKGQYDEARDYLTHSLSSSVIRPQSYVNIPNKIIGAVVNNKLATCEKLGIKASYRIFADFEGFNDRDLSVVLFNIFDNAIEAEATVREPYIEFEIKNVNDYLSVVVKNRIEKSVLKSNKALSTTKKDKALHGIGTKRIKELVEKNNGILGYYEEENMFVCTVMMSRN